MTLAAISNTTRGQAHGIVELTSEAARARLLGQAQEEGLLSVPLKAPGPALRGRLALFIEAAIEETLERRGCAPPGIGAATDLDASLSDQLYRARLIGCSGLALGFETLEGIATLGGALDAEDSAALRWWLAATHERPVRMYLDQGDRFLGIYGPPITLELLLRSAPGVISCAPTAAPEVAASLAAMNLSAPTPTLRGLGVAGDDLVASPAPRAEPSSPAGSSPDAGLRSHRERQPQQSATSRAMAALFADAREDVSSVLGRSEIVTEAPAPGNDASVESVDPDPASPGPAAAPERTASPEAGMQAVPCSGEDATADAVTARTSAEGDAAPVAPAEGELAAEPGSPDGGSPPEGDDRTEAPPVPTHEPPKAEAARAAIAPAVRAKEPPKCEAGRAATAPAVREPSPLHAAAREEWRDWMRELDRARGPKPLSAIERMFVSSFVPLSDACALGIADATARASLDAWSESFAQSYGDAYDALRVRGKRPTMVLDVPEIAQRLARLHGARAVELVLVDALRFDLGLRLHEQLRERLGQRAALTERLLLWSALPTTTAKQLELLARGPDGLREARGDPESTLPVARGRSAALLRRVRAGWRELYKLDLVEARLAEGPLTIGRMHELAGEAAAAIAAHLDRAQERTLVVVFGDHGFRLDADGRVQQGGASPEEVLVPAFAWLLGDVH